MSYAARVRYTTGNTVKVFEVPEGQDPFEVMERARKHLFPDVTPEQVQEQNLRAAAILAGADVKAVRPLSGVKETSLEAYSNLKASGRMSGQQLKVYALFDAGRDYTRQELAKESGLQINAICGRVAELLERGSIRVAGKRRCGVTGQVVEVLSVVRQARAA